MIDIKQAVESAAKYFSDAMTISDIQLEDIRLEEVEISDDERFWYVTLSALVPRAKPEHQVPISSVAALLAGDRERIYRVFTVRSDDGFVRSMKIRQT